MGKPIFEFMETVKFKDIVNQFEHLKMHVGPWKKEGKHWYRQFLNGDRYIAMKKETKPKIDKKLTERGYILHEK